jgi:hypothetical protein
VALTTRCQSGPPAKRLGREDDGPVENESSKHFGKLRASIGAE